MHAGATVRDLISYRGDVGLGDSYLTYTISIFWGQSPVNFAGWCCNVPLYFATWNPLASAGRGKLNTQAPAVQLLAVQAATGVPVYSAVQWHTSIDNAIVS
jgi:ABC-type uncharacterized transport system permease subunit